jgi:hypothetical protein
MNHLYFHNWKTKILILIFIFFITPHSFSQKKTEIKDTIPAYKNSLKGIAFALPIIPMIEVTASLGYERAMTKHSTIELGTYYLFILDEMGVKHHYFGIMPAYKYYTVSKNKLLNDFWISVYLSYLHDTHIYLEDNFRERIDYYGIGGTIGKRINLNKNERTFLDIGFGISYNFYENKSKVSNNDWSTTIRYRPIIQIGRKF